MTLENTLAKLARDGDIKIITDNSVDRITLTEKGLDSTRNMIRRMVSKCPEVLNPKSMTRDLAKVLEKHGICVIASFGCEIGRAKREEQFFFELRFRFMGGNRELCKLEAYVE